MARPTNDKKDYTVIVRINSEIKGYLEEESKKNGESISRYVRELIESERLCNTKKTDKKIKQGSNVIQNQEEKIQSGGNNVIQNIMREETYKDLEDMCRKSGVSIEVFFDRIRELWNEGRIYTEGFLIDCRGGYDLKELEETCHRANVNVQDMIDRLSKSMLRG